MHRITSVKQHGQSGGNAVAEKYVTFDYNELSQLTNIERFADLSGTEFVAETDYDRDYLGRLTQLDTYQGSTHFATYDLTYDAASRITAIDSVFSNSAWNENHDYTYDDTNQLTAADHSAQNDEAYAYDKNGNRTGNQTHLGATTSSTVTSDNRISTDGVYNYTWDDEGNMLTKTKISTGDKEEYTWDYRNRLSKITFKTSGGTITMVIEFRYDHNNLLLRRIETPYMYGSPQTSERDILVHDGDQIVLAFHKSGSGSVNLTNRYLWGPEQDLLLTDEQVTSLSSAGTVYWSFVDQVGSIVDLATYNASTNTTTIAKHRKYDAFGNVTSDSASGIKERFAYTGKWFEESFGATWHIHRWYDTVLGKWKSQDPIKDGVNWSAYVGNHPTGATDPSGLDREWAWNWHHMLDKAIFTDDFLASRGLTIDIHSARYGWMMRGKDHLYGERPPSPGSLTSRRPLLFACRGRK
jgi:RHS repeat-associated protein